jgi:hypothetical protein
MYSSYIPTCKIHATSTQLQRNYFFYRQKLFYQIFSHEFFPFSSLLLMCHSKLYLTAETDVILLLIDLHAAWVKPDSAWNFGGGG